MVEPESSTDSNSLWKEAGSRLQGEEVIGLPTETVFGLSADPYSETAIKKLYARKTREVSKGLPLIADSEHSIQQLKLIETEEGQELREKLQQKYWPGPLSLVIQPEENQFVSGVAAPDGSIAVRVSPLSSLRRLAELTGGFLVATSANLPGQKPASTSKEFVNFFPDLWHLPEFESSGQKLASTIVDIRSGKPVILREGACKL